MDNITRKSGDNFGSIVNLLFVPMINVSEIPLPDADIIDSTAIGLVGIDKWVNFAFTPETGRFKEEQVNSPTGVLYKVTVEIAVAKDNLNRFRTFFDMEYHEFLVLVRDANGNSHLIGYIDRDGSKFGMKFKTKSDTGEKRVALNAIECQFYMESRNKCRIAYSITDLPLNPDPSWVPDETAIPLFPPEE
jgi:hypothetical protein